MRHPPREGLVRRARRAPPAGRDHLGDRGTVVVPEHCHRSGLVGAFPGLAATVHRPRRWRPLHVLGCYRGACRLGRGAGLDAESYKGGIGSDERDASTAVLAPDRGIATGFPQGCRPYEIVCLRPLSGNVRGRFIGERLVPQRALVRSTRPSGSRKVTEPREVCHDAPSRLWRRHVRQFHEYRQSFFPLPAGTINSYGAEVIDPDTGEEETERNDHFATFETKTIAGIEARGRPRYGL